MVKEVKTPNREWMLIIIVLVILVLISMFIAGIISSVISGGMPTVLGNAVIIPIKGTILVEPSMLSFGEETATSSEIIKLIDKVEKDVNVKAIVFEINSPGGSAVASEEVANRVKRIKKPKVAWIREIGTSGAYWIASATDHIIANRMSITGSIGVISSYLDFSGFLSDHNVTYQRLVAGKYKDMGTPLKELTPMEKELFNERLDIIHKYFIDAVSENRGLNEKEANELATGIFYIGSQAKELKLVDELGGEEEVKNYLEKKLDMPIKLIESVGKKGFLEMLSTIFNKNAFYVGRGIGSSFGSYDIGKALKVVS